MTDKQKLLYSLVNEYIDDKDRYNSFKTICENENKRIKSLMEEMNINSVSTDSGYTVKYVISNRETMDEDRLLSILKNSFGDKFIVTKEYVDMDKLEMAMYRNEIPKDILTLMDDCRSVQKVISLKINRTTARED